VLCSKENRSTTTTTTDKTYAADITEIRVKGNSFLNSHANVVLSKDSLKLLHPDVHAQKTGHQPGGCPQASTRSSNKVMSCSAGFCQPAAVMACPPRLAQP
jgi:hypothetical protein